MSFTQTVRSFDISKVKYNDDGIIDFYWPLDNKVASKVLDFIADDVISFVTKNERKHPELVAVRLLFKWFLCEVLRLFEATVIAEECKRDGVDPIIPPNYQRLNLLYNGGVLECDFFARLASGPTSGRKVPRWFKRTVKEFLWNGLQTGLISKYGSNPVNVFAFNPSHLAVTHARGSNKILRYASYDEWFDPVPEQLLENEIRGSGGFQYLLTAVAKGFTNSGYSMSPAVREYIWVWLQHANNFVSFHLDRMKNLRNAMGDEVWFGCGGSSVWSVILIEKLRREKIRVVTHDHGSGNAHHEQTPAHWVEFMHTDVFVTFNSKNQDVKNAQFQPNLIFGQQPPLIQSLDNALGVAPSAPTPRVVTSHQKIKKVMYIGTAFHGEGTRLRPIFHDMTYFDWQIKLFSHLSNLDLSVIYKPHPEGATRVPAGFARSFGFKSIEKKFEDIDDDIDAYIIDFVFSSTTPSVLRSEKPVFFVDLGFPEISDDALELIKKRCYYYRSTYSDDSRLEIEFDFLRGDLSRESHIFHTDFPDIYFQNI